MRLRHTCGALTPKVRSWVSPGSVPPTARGPVRDHANVASQSWPIGSASSHLAVLLILPLLVLGTGVAAGPVPAGDAQGGHEAIEASAASLAGPSVGTSGAGLVLGDSARTAAAAASAGSDSSPSSSALAAEIIKDSEASATDTEPPSKPQRARNSAHQPAASTPSRGPVRATDDVWGVREMGKAVVHWLKESVPWLRSDADEGAADKQVVVNSADWSTSPLEGGKAGQNAMAGTMQGPGIVDPVGPGPWSSANNGNKTGALASSMDPEQNLVRKAAKLVREVLEHPMTWLVVSLVIIGSIAIKKADRRPK